MAKPEQTWSVSQRVYRALLVAYPKEFRDAYGPHMVQAFGDLCRDELRRGGFVGLWGWTLVDLAVSAFVERSGRGRTDVVRSSLEKWCGIAALVGGLLIIAFGVGYPTVGNGGLNTPSDVWYVLSLVEGFGSLLIFGGLLGLARLIRRRGVLGFLSTGRTGRLSWARRSAVGGLVLAALAALASIVETFWFLASAGGNFAVRPGSFLEALLFTLGVFRIFVLPLALVLLGVAVWRSGALGRWSVLPVTSVC